MILPYGLVYPKLPTIISLWFFRTSVSYFGRYGLIYSITTYREFRTRYTIITYGLFGLDFTVLKNSIWAGSLQVYHMGNSDWTSRPINLHMGWTDWKTWTGLFKTFLKPFKNHFLKTFKMFIICGQPVNNLLITFFGMLIKCW